MTNATTTCFLQKHNTVEISAFGSKFVAMWITRDLIVALRYKLRMFGVSLYGPSNVMYNNQGLANKTNLPQSTLGTKQNTVNYNVVREAASSGILQVGKEDTETNLACIMTNILG